MVKEIDYINIRELLSRVLRHPLLQDFNLEQAIQYTLDFIGLFGFPELYSDKEVELYIHDYRCMLPCDLVEIVQVKEVKSGICLRSMTDSFVFRKEGGKTFMPPVSELTFKTQGRVMFTSFPEGKVTVAYKAIPVDGDGLPLLIDNTKYLKALELYVKCQLFGVLFDMGKVTPQVLQHSEQEYAWAAGQLEEEFKTPSVSEMQSITNMLHQMIQRNSEFYSGFNMLGNKEFPIVHSC